MKGTPTALVTHQAGSVTTLATCLRVAWTNGIVKGYTDHDRDIDLGLSGYYFSLSGYNASDIASSSDLNVDNLEVIGATDATIAHPSITEEDLLAGKWDYADFQLFRVNWADLSMGVDKLRAGKLGEVGLDRAKFRAELRGMMQHYATTLGRVESPQCNATLGDARCGIDLDQVDSNGDPIFKKSGTIEAVSEDGLTVYDSARTEEGPTDTRDITGVTNANPGVVSYASAFDPPLVEGEPVVISEVVGPSSINVLTIVRNPSTTSFELGVDTSDTTDYPPYVSGGTVSRLGNSGFFDYGVLTITGTVSDNAGISREIKTYVPGQFTLQFPFPYPLQAGDPYTATAGCDKSFATCRDRFDNVVNFRGMPYLPGTDRIVQIGRRNQ